MMPNWLRRLLGREVAESGPAWIEVDDLRKRLAGADAPLIVDVRGRDEFDGPLGHIDGARNVPLDALPSHVPELHGAGVGVVLVCLTDKRSSQAAAQLTEAGIRDVSVLRGGMKAWRGA